MPTLGQEWYQRFWKDFRDYSSRHPSELWEKEVSDKAWSKAMFEILRRVARDMGFDKVEHEEGTIKGQRFDMVWRSSKDPKRVVVLEHKNNLVQQAIKEEVPKLVRARATLHVLLTYAENSEFPGSQYAKQIRKELEKYEYEDEFLLVLGSWYMISPSEWICHRIYRERKLGRELLSLASPIWLMP